MWRAQGNLLRKAEINSALGLIDDEEEEEEEWEEDWVS